MQGIIGFISDFNTVINLFWTDYKKRTRYYYITPKVLNRYNGYRYYNVRKSEKYNQDWIKKF